MTNELINEVEESLRKEQLENAWKEYGPWLIAGAICAVLLTAGVTGFRSWNERVNSKHTTVLMQALDAKDVPAELAKISGDLGAGQKAIARLTAAGALLREKKDSEALEYYKAAADDRGMPGMWRDLARVMAIRLEWSMPDVKDKTQEYLAQLKPIWSKTGNPWGAHAHLQAALIHAHDLTDYNQARTHLAAIMENENVPPSLLERARALDHVYALKSKDGAANAEKSADKPKEEPEG